MRKFILIFIMSVCIQAIFAQRHYAGISALELNYGQNIFGSNNHNGNLSFSKYRNRTTYWKVGFNYFEKSFEYSYEELLLGGNTGIKTINRLARDYYIDGNYFKTIATNMSSLYLNLGLGVFTGVESYKGSEDKYEYKYLVGPELSAELEYFVSRRFGFIGRITQYWNPFSKKEWNTVWNAGIKILIY